MLVDDGTHQHRSDTTVYRPAKCSESKRSVSNIALAGQQAYSRSTGNHANFQSQVGLVVHLALGPSDLELVADLELSYMSGYVSSGVCLRVITSSR